MQRIIRHDMHDTFYFIVSYCFEHIRHLFKFMLREKIICIPLRVLAPGRVYRCDSDPTHSPMFHQIEGLCIDKNINFCNLKWVLNDFIYKFFDSKKYKQDLDHLTFHLRNHLQRWTLCLMVNG